MHDSYSSADPRIILGLTAWTSLGLAPFAVHHMIIGEWLMALSVGALSLWLGGCAGYIWRSRSPEKVGLFVVLASNITVLWAVHRLGALGIHWAYVMILGIFYILPRRQAVVVNFITAPAAVLLAYPHVSAVELPRIVAGLALVSVFAYIFSRSVDRQRAELTRLVSVDPLTNTRNRRALNEAMEEAIYGFTRHGTPASLILLDLDHFKKINDERGHDAGDQVLVAVAQQLQARARLSDGVFRYGGEEFVVLATRTRLDSAALLADDLRRMVSEKPTLPSGRLTVSCGVAELLPGETREAWLKRADTALYLAKRQGRDRVVVDRMPEESAQAAA